MFDIGVTKIAIIGGIALVVIGPEKLPSVARTIGTLVGRARRYVADVKAEVNRSVDLDELKKMRETMESAAQDVHNTIQTNVQEFDANLQAAVDQADTSLETMAPLLEDMPVFKAVKKNWRAKASATPNWYKTRSRIKTRVQSGAARVKRHRPSFYIA